jgi:transposase
VDRKDPVDMEGYEDFSTYEEFDFSIKNPKKYKFFQDNGISYETYTISEKSKEALNWAYENQDKYTMSKAISDNFFDYWDIKKDLGEIDAKDESGETVSGLKKERVVEYINKLDLDYGSKIILYRSMYNSKADRAAYNMEIINYLDSREDISYDDMMTILKELDFNVEPDGAIWWE